MATTGIPEARIVIADDTRPPSPDQTMVDTIEETMNKATQRLEGYFSMMQTRIHRFPRGLRRIGGGADDDDRYVVPSVVAIGPYHHGLPHLQEMEELKHAAARYFCTRCCRSTKEVLAWVRSVAGDARHCYTADEAVARLSDDDFTTMMFLDGCFLLQYMAEATSSSSEPLFVPRTLSSGPSIIKDMMLLENQIPWLVLKVLMELMAQKPAADCVHDFVDKIGEKYFPKKEENVWSWKIQAFLRTFLEKCRGGAAGATDDQSVSITISRDCQPPHLLGMLRSSLIRSMTVEELSYHAGSSSLTTSSSAVELALIGVKLAPSTAKWFGDMRVQRKLVFGELSLSPVFLNDVTACWLVNMAALEAATPGTWHQEYYSDGFVVSSYLSTLAMLMDRKEDVHELRGKGVLRSVFSNSQTLAFFKGFGRNLRLGSRYMALLEQTEAYKRHRPVRIAINKFLYKNHRAIVTILSIAGVLVGIFKALLSLKAA